MKKRIVAALLSIMLICASPVTCLADNNYTTGTQENAKEGVVDVDMDIRDEIDAIIPDDIEEISIGTADELLELAKKCTLDTWSVNKKVVLTADINLLDKEFEGIPTFGGIFDGQGHKITEMRISEGLSYSGLFIYVQKSGIIRNLDVVGTVIPEGNTTIVGGIAGDNSGYINNCSFRGVVKGNDYIGGITGINELSGTINNCVSYGYVNGTHFTGGIAGKNDGNISNCKNEAYINTTNTDTEITLDSFEKLTSVVNLLRDGLDQSKDVAKESVTIYDAGGIAGQSIGIISRCINDGEIGYDHVGYNIGGIAGRQSGYIYKCSNNGSIKGRKDIGGIVGQAEPFITVDLSSDIAYQLEKAVAKLHDSVTVTLKDAKSQSNTISDRLAVIQKFTAGAVNDTRYISSGLIDYANGLSGSASEALSRVNYILDETSKNDGVFDKASAGMNDIGESAQDLADIAYDTDIEMYIDSEDELNQYRNAKKVLDSATAQYSELTNRSKRVYYNLAIRDNKGSYAESADLVYNYKNGEAETNLGSWSTADIGTGLKSDAEGIWIHADGDLFPEENNTDDYSLEAMASAKAAYDSSQYAMANYVNPITGVKGKYTDDISSSTSTILGIYEKHLPEMGDEIRSDAQSAMNNLDKATEDFASASNKTKEAFKNVVGRGQISFPQFSSDYKAHTVSLADNMQAMNDNFGLLNSEVNNANGIIIDDLLNLSDQFNNVLNLYTDAIDGVLEKDYTQIYTDQSYEAVNYTTDATIDSCFNYGECAGDISISGIAGTMAIDYDFDKEGAITGVKGNPINTSYLTRCVLRDNRNYGEITSLKNYAGGVCGLQEMGTIMNCGSYSKVRSSSGDYVGGIAGSSLAHIIKSYAKGELDGNNYVGGIAGNGEHIKECLTIVTVGNAENWYGAIAGHVDEKGEVRDNYFVSDNLAGIDRVSYALKAEPISYDAVMDNKVFKELEEETEEKEKKEKKETNVVALSAGKEGEEDSGIVYKELPYEFSKLSVSFILEDEDLENGKKKIGQVSKKYGDSIILAEYPRVEEKEGYYVTWDKEVVENIVSDVTITAKYKRFRTTIAGESETKGFYQSQILVDGLFKDDDRLIVEKTKNYSGDDIKSAKEALQNVETLKIKIPDDGAETHQIRFRPENEWSELAEVVPFASAEEYNLYRIDGDQRILLTKTGTMGKYSTYDVGGNDVVLELDIRNLENVTYIYIGIAAVILIIIIIIIAILVLSIKRNKGILPKALRGIRKKVSQRIESKEQIFYDDSQDDLLMKEIEEYKKSLRSADESEPEQTSEEKKEPEKKKKKSGKKNKK